MPNILKALWVKIFPPGPPEAPPRDVSALVSPFVRPAVHLSRSDGSSRSHFGGDPRLAAGLSWPGRNGKPLTFLARISLAEVHGVLPLDWLPTTGALLFFYDVDNQPWGFDPKDRGSWAVLLVDDLGESQPDRASGPALAFRSIAPRRITSYPSGDRECLDALHLTDTEYELLLELQTSEFRDESCHQMSGYPEIVQGDTMELECQLASNGLYCGDERGYRDPRVEELRPGAEDWRLLLQFGSDDDLDVMWGDAGTVYFWVRDQDARAGDFGNTWLVLQCC